MDFPENGTFNAFETLSGVVIGLWCGEAGSVVHFAVDPSFSLPTHWSYIGAT